MRRSLPGSLFACLFVCLLLSSCGTPTTSPHTKKASPKPTKVLYVLTEAGVGAYQETNGALLWSYSYPDVLAGYSMSVAPDTVYVAENTKLHALNSKNGKERWTTPTVGNPDSTAWLSNTLLLGSGGTVYGYSGKDGSLLWRTTIPAVNTSSDGDNKTYVFIANQHVFARYGDTLVSINIKDGSLLWKYTCPSQNADDVSAMITSLTISPSLFILTNGYQTAGIQVSSGQPKWKIAPQKNLSVTNNTAYMYSNGDIEARSLADGHLLWQIQDKAVTDLSPMVFSNTTYFAATGPSNGDIEARSLVDGHLLWTTPGTGTYTALVASNSIVYASLDQQQGIAAFDAAKKTRLWLLQNIDEIQLLGQQPYVSSSSSSHSLVLAPLDTHGNPRWEVSSLNNTVAVPYQIIEGTIL